MMNEQNIKIIGNSAFIGGGMNMVSIKNPVFTNAADAFFANNNQSQRLLARFSKTDYLFRIFLTYSFDGSKPFRP